MGQTNRQADRQPDKQTYRQTDRHTGSDVELRSATKNRKHSCEEDIEFYGVIVWLILLKFRVKMNWGQ